MREELLRTLLLVDADGSERRALAATASRAGWSVTATGGAEAREILAGAHGREVRAVLVSGWDPVDGPALIAELRVGRPDLPVLVLAEQESIPLAVEAMRAGASDFLVKPVAPERMLEALNAHRDRRRPTGELAPVAEKLAVDLSLDELVGGTPDFRSA